MLVSPAFAKLNLTLDVLGRRDDGLHDIESVLLTIDWHDLVGVEIAPAAVRACRLTVSGTRAGEIPSGRANLAFRAAEELSALAGSPLEVMVWIHKRLPSRAGLGGGSADAAAVLRSGSQLLASAGRPVAAGPLLDSAQRLGADVPALLSGGLQLITGTGERSQSFRHVDLDCVVAVAGVSDTGAAYGNLVPAEHGGNGRGERVIRSLHDGLIPPPGDLGSALEAAAARGSPDLAEGLKQLRRATPGHAGHLTGSGGCAFAIAGSARDAAGLAAAVCRAGLAARACRSVRAS